MAYWEGDPETWSLIERVQDMKAQYAYENNPREYHVNHSERYVMVNPVTGQDVTKEELRYAVQHLAEIYSSGMIREDRFAFLWYH